MAQEATLAAPAPFSPGGTLNTSFAVLGRNLLPFVVVTFIISLPYILIQSWFDYVAAAAAANPSLGRAPGTAVASIAMIFVQTVTFGLVQAALAYGTVQDLRGQRAGVAGCLKGGLARSGSIAGGALQYGFALGLATLLLIIPGILLYLRWWVFMPAMVIEGLTPSESFERSRMLTAERRWAIFGLTALVFVVEIGLLFGVGMIVGGFAADFLATLIAVLFTTFSSIVAAVGYFHLRVEKEGVLIDDLAQVFD